MRLCIYTGSAIHSRCKHAFFAKNLEDEAFIICKAPEMENVRKMLLKRILTVGILIAVACASANFFQLTKASANVMVASHSSYRDALNYYWVFGEVKNTGDVPATNISIDAYFYDASDNIVNSSNTVVAGSYGIGKSIVLLPGAEAPFYMLILPQSGTANFDHCGFAVSFEECASKNTGFQIPFSQCVRYQYDSVENVNVSGALKNTAVAQIQEGVNFYATLYDPVGTVIGQGYVYEEENLLPGQVVAFNFQVATFFPAQAANFTVTVQSANYTIEDESSGVVIPEFPSFLITSSFITITLFTILVIRRKRSESFKM
jgi:hypothetical protein